MKRLIISLSILGFTLFLIATAPILCDIQSNKSTIENLPILKGPYLGQPLPGKEPVIFAPGIVSRGMMTRDFSMTPDGHEIYYTVMVGQNTFYTIITTKYEKEKWTNPEVAAFASDPHYINIEPCVSPDGKQFFFVTNRPYPGETAKKERPHIWTMERTGDSWGEPKPIGSPINSEIAEYYPSLTNDKTIYFTIENKDQTNDIYRSRIINGEYSTPEKLPPQVNCGTTRFNAFVAPDESYLIVCVMGKKENIGAVDYYIVFRNKDDSWNPPVNMGNKINTSNGNGYTPYVTRDGKYFLFMSARVAENLFPSDEILNLNKIQELHNRAGNGNACLYWVDASFINDLKMISEKQLSNQP